jgi:hypothetical protein
VEKPQGRVILGSDEFLARVAERLTEQTPSKRYPVLRDLLQGQCFLKFSPEPKIEQNATIRCIMLT